MTVCLVMLARDEERVIARAIESVRPLIDTWMIQDTGSRDRTQEAAEKALEGIPGRYVHEPWQNFAHNRTKLLQDADGMADYLFTLDADMTVAGEIPDLEHDCYYVSIGEGFSWRLPLLTRSGKPWSYKGVCHSYLSCDEPFSGENLDTILITHHAEGRPREQKFRRDIELLNEYLKDHPDDPRSVYYLAQSHKDIGDLRSAAELYERRAKLRGWAEEQFHARYQEGKMRLRLGEDAKGVWSLLEAHAFRPTRAEPLRALADYYAKRGCQGIAEMFDDQADRIPFTSDRLFVERDAYGKIGGSFLSMNDSEEVPELDLPEVDEWMLPHDFYRYLALIVRARQPSLIVECGSGASTVVLAALQKEHDGKLITLEHDPEFHRRTRELLDWNGLDCTLSLCPLGKNQKWLWYTDLPEIGKIDVLLVDGPPARLAYLARYPALPILADRLSEGAPVILDDIQRQSEKRIARRWMREFDLKAERLHHSKGAAALFSRNDRL